MNPDELRALADALSRQRQADEHGIYCAVPRQAVDAAIRHLRAQADAQPVAIVGEQRSGAWAGVDTPSGYVWSPPSDSGTKMIFPLADLPLGTKLYTRPAPAVPQAEPIDPHMIVADDRFPDAQAEPKRKPTCLWSRADDDTDVWETSCGHAFTIIEGTPSDNHMEFCCYCGRRVDEEIGGSDE